MKKLILCSCIAIMAFGLVSFGDNVVKATSPADAVVKSQLKAQQKLHPEQEEENEEEEGWWASTKQY